MLQSGLVIQAILLLTTPRLQFLPCTNWYVGTTTIHIVLQYIAITTCDFKVKVGDCEVYTSPNWNTLSATPVPHQVIAYLSAVEIKMVLTLRLSQVLLVLKRLPPMYERDIVVRLDNIPRKCQLQRPEHKILLLNFFLTKEAV